MVGVAVGTGLVIAATIVLVWVCLKRRYRIVKVHSERGKVSSPPDSIESGRLRRRRSSPARPPIEMPVGEAVGTELPETGGVELPIRQPGESELPTTKPLQEKEKLEDGGWV